MARSRRRTPIFGITTARSEKLDKKSWHRRLRAQSRDQLKGIDASSAEEADGLVPVDVRDVSNPWSMAKDGKHYWSPSRQQAFADRMAQTGQSIAEQISLRARYLHKAMAK